MSAVAALKYYSIAEYLAAEDRAEFKSEYFAGEIYPMAGGTINHNRIAGNTHFALKMALKGKPFEVFIGDVKLHIPVAETFAYPDVLVIKGKPDYWQNRRDVICNASLIVEVLSDSTQDYDRSGKFEIYRNLPDLQDYILISQHKVHVEHFVKQSARQWLLTDYFDLNDVLNLAQFGESLSLSDIYDKVDFEPKAKP